MDNKEGMGTETLEEKRRKMLALILARQQQQQQSLTQTPNKLNFKRPLPTAATRG